MAVINGQFREYKLDNGLVVALQETPTQTIAAKLRVNYGTAHERDGEEKMNDIGPIIEAIEEIKEDVAVPKNVKTKLSGIIGILKEEGDFSLKVNKALSELDEIADDTNLQPYTRTQVWNLVSLLEAL